VREVGHTQAVALVQQHRVPAQQQQQQQQQQRGSSTGAASR
jgi:hypothetical protein